MLTKLVTKGGRTYDCGDDPAVSLESKTEEIKQARLNNDFVTCGISSVDAHEVEAIVAYKVLADLGGTEKGTAYRFVEWLKQIGKNP